MDERLLPCPFCGHNPELKEDKKIKMLWYVQCEYCGCRMSGSPGRYVAIRRWNDQYKRKNENIVEMICDTCSIALFVIMIVLLFG